MQIYIINYSMRSCNANVLSLSCAKMQENKSLVSRKDKHRILHLIGETRFITFAILPLTIDQSILIELMQAGVAGGVVSV